MFTLLLGSPGQDGIGLPGRPGDRGEPGRQGIVAAVSNLKCDVLQRMKRVQVRLVPEVLLVHKELRVIVSFVTMRRLNHIRFTLIVCKEIQKDHNIKTRLYTHFHCLNNTI